MTDPFTAISDILTLPLKVAQEYKKVAKNKVVNIEALNKKNAETNVKALKSLNEIIAKRDRLRKEVHYTKNRNGELTADLQSMHVKLKPVEAKMAPRESKAKHSFVGQVLETHAHEVLYAGFALGTLLLFFYTVRRAAF